ncbi:hypothetical protein MNB_SV-12-289 [hydrothermal vent metagenome]|uniref:Transposase (putative) YhgA-like domain-containing protein n=1 Tax=hydrothermal vent metagenome TaxID=652676 RepID=A0A1W1BUA4_9ZZZZ
MGKKDIISKDILKNIARDISKHILHIDIKDDMEIINPDFERIESRESDLLFKNGNEIVHIEIQNDNHTQMHLRMGRYYMDILFLYEKYKISQYMIYIGKKKCYMKSKIKRDKIEYSYVIIDMRDIACEELLKSNDSSAIALSILCDFKGQDKQSVVNTILRKLRELNNDRDFEKYLEIVTLYSTNRGLEKEIDKGVKMLTFDIEKTPFYQIGVQTGAENAKRETTFKNAIAMIEKLNLSIDVIVQTLNIKKEELLEYMKKKKESQIKED